MEFENSISEEKLKESRGFWKRVSRFLIKLIKYFFVLSILSVIVFRFIPIPITPFMIQNSVEQLFDSSRKMRLEKHWEPMRKISTNIQLAAVCAEDQNFYRHYGFDFEAIKKAVKYNKTHDKKIGASTITQQTAKNAFLFSNRNYLRKALEAYFTILIEVFWSKDRILEVYLNIIEFGNGIYGVEAASQHFFKKSAADLSRNEAALLIAVLPNPIRFQVDHPSKYVNRRKSRILKNMSRSSLESLKAPQSK